MSLTVKIEKEFQVYQDEDVFNYIYGNLEASIDTVAAFIDWEFLEFLIRNLKLDINLRKPRLSDLLKLNLDAICKWNDATGRTIHKDDIYKVITVPYYMIENEIQYSSNPANITDICKTLQNKNIIIKLYRKKFEERSLLYLMGSIFALETLSVIDSRNYDEYFHPIFFKVDATFSNYVDTFRLQKIFDYGCKTKMVYHYDGSSSDPEDFKRKFIEDIVYDLVDEREKDKIVFIAEELNDTLDRMER